MLSIEPKPDEPQDGVPPAGQVSPLDELRAVFEAIDDDTEQTEVFDVEGSNAAVRYRRMSYDAVRAALASDGNEVERNAQFLIEACDEILIRNTDGDLEPVITGERITFDLRPGESVSLAKALGADEPDVRRSVLRLFKGVDQALLRHAQAVDAWMATARRTTAEKFAGG